MPVKIRANIIQKKFLQIYLSRPHKGVLEQSDKVPKIIRTSVNVKIFKRGDHSPQKQTRSLNEPMKLRLFINYKVNFRLNQAGAGLLGNFVKFHKN